MSGRRKSIPEIDPASLVGERVSIHYNLQRCRPGTDVGDTACFVVSNKPAGRVIGYVRSIALEDVEPKIYKKELARIRTRQRRKVCCYIVGTVVPRRAVKGRLTEVSFNPFEMPCFYKRGTTLCVDSADFATFDGTTMKVAGAATSPSSAGRHKVNPGNGKGLALTHLQTLILGRLQSRPEDGRTWPQGVAAMRDLEKAGLIEIDYLSEEYPDPEAAADEGYVPVYDVRAHITDAGRRFYREGRLGSRERQTAMRIEQVVRTGHTPAKRKKNPGEGGFWEGGHGKPPQPSPYSILKGVEPVTRQYKGFELFAVQQARTGTWFAKALGYDEDYIGVGPDAQEALARAAMYLDADIPPREKMNPRRAQRKKKPRKTTTAQARAILSRAMRGT